MTPKERACVRHIIDGFSKITEALSAAATVDIGVCDELAAGRVPTEQEIIVIREAATDILKSCSRGRADLQRVRKELRL